MVSHNIFADFFIVFINGFRFLIYLAIKSHVTILLIQLGVREDEKFNTAVNELYTLAEETGNNIADGVERLYNKKVFKNSDLLIL